MTTNTTDSHPLVIRHAQAMEEAEAKAWKALAGYKFEMFGYWASTWVSLNHLDDVRRGNPFKQLVVQARYDTERLDRDAAPVTEWKLAKTQGHLVWATVPRRIAGGHAVDIKLHESDPDWTPVQYWNANATDVTYVSQSALA